MHPVARWPYRSHTLQWMRLSEDSLRVFWRMAIACSSIGLEFVRRKRLTAGCGVSCRRMSWSTSMGFCSVPGVFSVTVKNTIDGLSEWGESVLIGSGDKIGIVRGESSISDILGGEIWTAGGRCSSKRGWRGEGDGERWFCRSRWSLTISRIVCQKCALAMAYS